MLEGLDASEVRRTQLNDDTRVDAEYFRKRYIAEDAQISRHEVQPLGELAFITDGQHGYHEVDEASPIHMLTAQSARGWFADTMGADRIARWVDDNNKRSSLQESDLILSTRGTVGLCAIVMPEALPANIDQDVARLHLKSKKLIPEYLLAYLNSNYGQDWMARNQSGAVQQGLSLAKVRLMPIPLLSRPVQQRIGGIIEAAYRQLARSRDLYDQAEGLLLRELGLKDWQPKDPLSYVVPLNETIKTGRLDAEYYRPSVVALLRGLKDSGCISLDSIASVSSGYPWKSEYFLEANSPGHPFARIRDCKPGLLDNDTLTRLETAYADGEKVARAQEGDILLGMDGLRWFFACQISAPCYVNQRVCHISPINRNEYPSEYLAIVINSMIGQVQLLREMTVAQTVGHITNENARQLKVPILTQAKRSRMAAAVSDSYRARRDSKDLLEKAKRAVEIAIERGEEAANEYLDGKAYVQSSVLPAMTEQHKYFSLGALKRYLANHKLIYTPETVNAYVSQMKSEGKIFSAGRGWYTSLETPFEIDPEPVTGLVADVEKKFPLLDFSCWSTGQLNPYLHHMLGKFVPFVYVGRDAMSSVYDALQELGYNAYLNPTRREAEKSFHVADKTVVIRPAVAKAPGDGHVARVEKLLVDLHVELDTFHLIEKDEFREAAQAMISQRRIELAKLITYAAQRKVAWREIFMNPDAVIAGGDQP